MANLSDKVEIANPQQPHCATVLLLDVSGSMDGSKIQQLNEGLRFFKDDICGTDDDPGDELAKKRVDLAIVTFSSGAELIQDFTSMESFEPPTLQAGGSTDMGGGIQMAAQIIERRKQEYKAKGMDYFRPWLFMITDGEPTDMSPGDGTWKRVSQLVKDGESKKQFTFFPVGVEPANMDILKQLSPSRAPVMLRHGMFKKMFEWLSNSLSGVSASKVGESTPLQNPTGPNGWADVPG